MDVLICTSEMLAPICALAVVGTKCRYVAWLHANIDVTGEYRLQGMCRKIAAKTAKQLVVLTQEMRERYAERFHLSGIQAIGNPVDERLMAPATYAAQSRRILSVGRLVYAKNYEMLIDVADIVLKKHTDWSWDIYGDGRLRDALQTRIEEAGLAGRLRLMGAVDDIYDRYGEYAFLVMTSRYEGFPMVLLEGMARGLPLVSYDISTGPKYIITHGENGFLVSDMSAKGMAEAVEKLIENEDKRRAMSEANLKKREAFSLEAVLTEWEKVLQRLPDRDE